MLLQGLEVRLCTGRERAHRAAGDGRRSDATATSWARPAAARLRQRGQTVIANESMIGHYCGFTFISHRSRHWYCQYCEQGNPLGYCTRQNQTQAHNTTHNRFCSHRLHSCLRTDPTGASRSQAAPASAVCASGRECVPSRQANSQPRRSQPQPMAPAHQPSTQCRCKGQP